MSKLDKYNAEVAKLADEIDFLCNGKKTLFILCSLSLVMLENLKDLQNFSKDWPVFDSIGENLNKITLDLTTFFHQKSLEDEETTTSDKQTKIKNK